MAIFHLHHTIKGRAKIKSIVAAAAYRAGDALRDEQTKRIYDYTQKRGVLHSEISAPKDAPSWVHNRAEFWNRLDYVESHSRRPDDAQLAHSFDIALPHELTTEQQIFLVRDFVRENFTRKGLVSDWAIHAPDKDGNGLNFHVHILVAMRPIEGQRFARQKPRTFGRQAEIVREWRQRWAKLTNRHLARYGIEARIDERAQAEQAKDAPTPLPPSAFLGVNGGLAPLASCPSPRRGTVKPGHGSHSLGTV